MPLLGFLHFCGLVDQVQSVEISLCRQNRRRYPGIGREVQVDLPFALIESLMERKSDSGLEALLERSCP